MDNLCASGQMLKKGKRSDPAKATERRSARSQRFARAGLRLSVVHEAGFAAFHAQELGPLEEAEALVDPLDPFANEAENRLEQDSLMMAGGIRPRVAQRRFQRYLKHCTDPVLSTTAVVLKNKEQVHAVVFTSAGLAQYVPC